MVISEWFKLVVYYLASAKHECVHQDKCNDSCLYYKEIGTHCRLSGCPACWTIDEWIEEVKHEQESTR